MESGLGPSNNRGVAAQDLTKVIFFIFNYSSYLTVLLAVDIWTEHVLNFFY